LFVQLVMTPVDAVQKAAEPRTVVTVSPPEAVRLAQAHSVTGLPVNSEVKWSTQAPAMHPYPEMQSAAVTHVEGQDCADPSHRYGVQDGLPACPSATPAQVPVVHVAQAPEQAVLQHTEATQKPEEHCPAEAQATPLASFVARPF
jgi:hypothetical protein